MRNEPQLIASPDDIVATNKNADGANPQLIASADDITATEKKRRTDGQRCARQGRRPNLAKLAKLSAAR